MGTPVEPGKKGDDCLLIYPPGNTPKYLLAEFTDIEMCPGIMLEPRNGAFILTQSPISPCTWERINGIEHIHYIVDINGSRLSSWSHLIPYFNSHSAEPGMGTFENEVNCGGIPPVIAPGFGYVDLFDFPGRAWQQAHDFNLMPTAYTKFDVFTCLDEPAWVSVRRFGNVRTPTNVKVKFDATHYDQWEMFEKED